MRPFNYDELPPAARIEFGLLTTERDELRSALENAVRALEWCAQWITGEEDAKQVGIDLDMAKAALKKK